MKYARSLLILLFATGTLLAQPQAETGRSSDHSQKTETRSFQDAVKGSQPKSQLKVPLSKHVKSLYSGGDPRSYSEDIKANQQKFAGQRGMNYHFHDLNKADSSVMKALNGKQKYWAKIVILQQAMNDKTVPENSWVAWVDDDIVINDGNDRTVMMDQVVEKYGKDKSVIVAKEQGEWAYLNTGIILVKKDKGGRDVLGKLMEKSQQSKFGKLDQSKSFHEQGALKDLFTGKLESKNHKNIDLNDNEELRDVQVGGAKVTVVKTSSKRNEKGKKEIVEIVEIVLAGENEIILAVHEHQKDGRVNRVEVITSKSALELDKDMQPLARHVAVVPQREGELNFNNFRRYSHTDEKRIVVDPKTKIKGPMQLVFDDNTNAKARSSDAYIHHTGMKESIRTQVIKATIMEVNDPESIKKLPILMSEIKSDEELKEELKEEQKVHRREERQKVTSKKYPLQVVSKSSTHLDMLEKALQERDTVGTLESRRAVLQSAVLTEKELDTERKEHREGKREKAKKRAILISKRLTATELKGEQKEHRKKAKADAHKQLKEKKRGVLLSSAQTDEELKAEQKAHRKQAKAEARKKLDEKKQTIADVSNDEMVQNIDSDRDASDFLTASRAQTLSEISESAEQGILGLESLNNAASLMMLTTMAGFSSAMSSFRSGRAFSYGMTSIDDVVPSDAVASIHPSASGRTVNREVGSWHNFVQINMLQGSRKAVDGLPGGSVRGHGLTTGVFYQLNQNLITGMMLSIGKTNYSLSQSGGSGSMESISVGPFLSYTHNDWHIDAALTYSDDSYELKRRDSAGVESRSKFSGHSLTGYLGVGYDIHLDSLSPLLTLTPVAELIQINSSHGGYQEKHSQGKGVKVGSSTSQLTITRLGLELGYLLPELETPMEFKVRVGVQHQKSEGHTTSYELPFGVQGQLNVPGSSEKALYTGLAFQRQLGRGHLALSYAGTHSATSNSHGLQLEYERSF